MDKPNTTKLRSSSECITMDEVYTILKDLTVEQLQECIDGAPCQFIRFYARGDYKTYQDCLNDQNLFIYQCQETINRKNAALNEKPYYAMWYGYHIEIVKRNKPFQTDTQYKIIFRNDNESDSDILARAKIEVEKLNS